MRIEDRTIELSAEEGSRIVALGLLEEANAAADALSAGKGEEPLHDFRVSVRRLRSALRTLRPWIQESVRPRHEKDLKRLARSTNEARDAEVQLAWLAGRRDALTSVRLRPGYDKVVAWFEARAHSGPDAARVAERFGRLAGKLGRRLGTYERRIGPGGDAGASFGAVLASLVEDQIAVLAERMAAIRDALDEEAAHRARIEGKRLRYLLEPLRGYRHADASDVIRHLKRLQDVLGDLHDAHVLSGELRDALVEAASERARRIHAAAYAGTTDAALRDGLRGSTRPGLVALVRQVRERRDALFADLDREWRTGGMDALAAEVRALAAALAARAGGKLEHERKFLLAALPPRAAEEQAADIAQGWLPGARLHERIRRVRAAGGGERYWRTVKQGSGRIRLEAEEEASREIFDALWPLTEGRRVAKRRYRVHDGALLWEIDEFTDRELVVAEVELPARAIDVALPDWLQPLVVREVTGDPAYLNENLAITPGPPPAPPGASEAPLRAEVAAAPSAEP